MSFLNPVKRVINRSNNILDVFTKTVTDLQTVNNQIDTHVTKHEAKIQKLSTNLATLNQVREDNNKVINKINTFFN